MQYFKINLVLKWNMEPVFKRWHGHPVHAGTAQLLQRNTHLLLWEIPQWSHRSVWQIFIHHTMDTSSKVSLNIQIVFIFSREFWTSHLSHWTTPCLNLPLSLLVRGPSSLPNCNFFPQTTDINISNMFNILQACCIMYLLLVQDSFLCLESLNKLQEAKVPLDDWPQSNFLRSWKYMILWCLSYFSRLILGYL